MTVPFRPILSALLRNRTGALLVALQISIALAVLVNAAYIVKQRVDKIGQPTGIDVENIFVVSSTGFAREFDYPASLRDDLAWLRNIPGVVAAAPVSAVPLGGSASFTILSHKPITVPSEKDSVNYFLTDEGGLDTLGLRLIAGRWFRSDEIIPPVDVQTPDAPQAVVTKALANRLFPDGSALGKTMYDFQNQPTIIIGIVEHMLGSRLSGDRTGDIVSFMPRTPAGPNVRYLVRTEPGLRDSLMRKVEAEMGPRNPQRAIQYVRSLEMFRDRTYLADRNMGIFLVTTTALLLAITSLGIFGLATFNVSTRTKQIGTRRAVGARRRDIVRHFLTENWMISTAGVVVGCILALAAGHWLSLEYNLPRVDLYYLVIGVLALWGIGIAAAWQPARKAARISPALATRNV
jgi:putative ABC transport system permease protein